MPMITTAENVEIYYKDWGTGRPIVFSHGWPLSADDWDAQKVYDDHELLMFHGQRCCFYRKPECARCTLYDLCPAGQTRTLGATGK